jgi:uncharacterized protein YbcI
VRDELAQANEELARLHVLPASDAAALGSLTEATPGQVAQPERSPDGAKGGREGTGVLHGIELRERGGEVPEKRPRRYRLGQQAVRRFFKGVPILPSVGFTQEGDADRGTMPQEEESLRGGRLSAAISNAMVSLISEYTGRGPTKARTNLGEDLASCVLEDTLTKGERSLVAAGQADVVLQMRRSFQNAMREDAIEAVEQLTGRRVAAFLSDNHIDPDLAVETFVFEPRAGVGDEQRPSEA